MKIAEFEEARILATQRMQYENRLRTLELPVVHISCCEKGGNPRYIEDEHAMSFTQTALTSFYQEKIARVDRALIALGVEL